MSIMLGTFAGVFLVMAGREARYTATRHGGEPRVYLGLAVVCAVAAWMVS